MHSPSDHGYTVSLPETRSEALSLNRAAMSRQAYAKARQRAGEVASPQSRDTFLSVAHALRHGHRAWLREARWYRQADARAGRGFYGLVLAEMRLAVLRGLG